MDSPLLIHLRMLQACAIRWVLACCIITILQILVMTIEIKAESFQDNQIGGYVNKYNLTKWTISGNDHSLKLLGRTVGTNKPLIIGFHGWLGSQNNHFYDLRKEDVDEASLIFPQDRCGYLRAGSWYLGELTGNNEYTYPALLKIFLDNIVKEIKPSKIIAFGTSTCHLHPDDDRT